jgi:hypothetical protein
MEDVNPFEREARDRKAWAISRVLVAHGATVETAGALGSLSREIAAELAGTHPPSERTWALVVEYVGRRAAFGEAS